MRLPTLAPVVGIVAGLAVTYLPGTPPEDGIRARPARPFACGSGPGLAEAMARRHAWVLDAVGPSPTEAAVPDVDLGNVAVLSDGGNLVASGFADTNAMVQQFYLTHPDDFDYVTIFISSAYNTDVQIESGFAFHRRVASDVLGIGVNPVDRAAELGLTTLRLRSILQMNDVLEYTPRFDDRMLQFVGSVEGVEILGHETAHQFVAFAEVSGEGMLGRGDAHWSFFMNTEASVMEGNRWLQSGREFTSAEGFESFSQLDRYLMGLLAPEDVTEPIFVIQNPKQTGGRVASSLPEAGVTIQGSRRDIDLSEIVGAEGPRIPFHLDAPHSFTMALILVVPDGAALPPGDLDRIESFRRTFLEWFSLETEGVGSVDTALPGISVSAEFEAETFAGPAPLTVAFRDRSAGPTSSWVWDFGDGATSSETDPVHTYTDPGFYTVRLTVDGPGGPSTRIRHNLMLVQPFVERIHEDFETFPGDWNPSAADDAITGRWVLDDPIATGRVEIAVQPEDDASPDPGSLCWITGNAEEAGVAGGDDVDGGSTSLVSRAYDLEGAQAPVVEFAQWYSNGMGGEPGTDQLRVEASPDDGTTWFLLDATRRGDRVWRTRQLPLTLVPTAQVRFRIVASDLGLGSLVEAGIDEFRVLSLSGLPDADADALPDAIDNCVDLPNPGQSDVDQDGVGGACDCDDLDAEAGLFPGDDAVIEAVPFDPDRFQWSADPAAIDYNVYKGMIEPAGAFGYVHACFEKRSVDTETVDSTLPAVGGLQYYLVAPRNNCGEADLGLASDGTVRPLDPPCPPPIQPQG